MYFLIKDFGDEEFFVIEVKNLKQLNRHVEALEKSNVPYLVVKEITLAEVTTAMIEEVKT